MIPGGKEEQLGTEEALEVVAVGWGSSGRVPA
jgi:hypothetical protein